MPVSLSVLVNDIAAPTLITGLASHDLLYNAAGPLSWLLALATIWPLLLRRRAPVAMFFVSLAAFAALIAISSPPFAGFALLPGLYTVAAHRPLRTAIGSAAALELFVVLVGIQQGPAGSVDDTILILSAASAAALLLGTTCAPSAAISHPSRTAHIDSNASAPTRRNSRRTRSARKSPARCTTSLPTAFPSS